MRSEKGQRFSRPELKHVSANYCKNGFEINEVKKHKVDSDIIPQSTTFTNNIKTYHRCHDHLKGYVTHHRQISLEQCKQVIERVYNMLRPFN